MKKTLLLLFAHLFFVGNVFAQENLISPSQESVSGQEKLMSPSEWKENEWEGTSKSPEMSAKCLPGESWWEYKCRVWGWLFPQYCDRVRPSPLPPPPPPPRAGVDQYFVALTLLALAMGGWFSTFDYRKLRR